MLRQKEVCILALLALAAGVANADVIVQIDQAWDNTALADTSRGAYYSSSTSFRDVGQSFRAGLDNIVKVDLYLSRTTTMTADRTVTVSIYATDGQWPTGDALISATMQSSAISTASAAWYSFDLSKASLTVGNTYAIVLSIQQEAHAGSISLQAQNKPAGYAYGKNLERKDGPTWTSSNQDAMFRTYGEVPEPGTLALIGVGAAAIVRRRRR